MDEHASGGVLPVEGLRAVSVDDGDPVGEGAAEMDAARVDPALVPVERIRCRAGSEGEVSRHVGSRYGRHHLEPPVGRTAHGRRRKGADRDGATNQAVRRVEETVHRAVIVEVALIALMAYRGKRVNCIHVGGDGGDAGGGPGW